jgi:hypothetical protein
MLVAGTPSVAPTLNKHLLKAVPLKIVLDALGRRSFQLGHIIFIGGRKAGLVHKDPTGAVG